MFSYRIDDKTSLILPEERYAEEVYALVESNREELARWMTWLKEDYSLDDSRQWIRQCLLAFTENRGITSLIKVENKIAGTIGYNRFDWSNESTEIGYWLDKNYQGSGLMTRCCQALVENAFLQLGLHRVVIRCAVENARSRAIPERLGFVEEGLERQSTRLHDHFADMVVYSKLKND